MKLGDASAQWREDLKKEVPPIDVMNSVSITKYYDYLARMLEQAEDLNQTDELAHAYIYYKRWSALGFRTMPNHNYFNDPRYRKLKQKLKQDADYVSLRLKDLVARMDERSSEFKKEEEENRLKHEARLRENQAKLAIKNKNNQNAPAAAAASTTAASFALPSAPCADQEAALNCDSLLNALTPMSQVTVAHVPQPSSNTSYPEVNRPRHLDSSPHDAIPSAPQLAVEAPPAYNIATDLAPPPSYGSLSVDMKAQVAGESCRDLKGRVNQSWEDLKARRRVEYSYLRTYQGRLPGPSTDSTNGCAVIAPLVCFRHIKTKGRGMLPQNHIEHVIDKDTAPILCAIRRKHHLPEGSFIVPADSHDFLYDEGYMDPSIFGGVFGGNVLSEENLSPLFEEMENFPPNEKAAAAFFFHEHVVAILKFGPDEENKYEFVDSLPHHPAGVGVRIGCRTASELAVCLAWYCLSKMSGANMTFIDSNPWDEVNAEFDPRLFQAFLWHAEI